MGSQSIQIKDPTDFEKVVALSFKRKGYQITMPPANTKGYGIEYIEMMNVLQFKLKTTKPNVT